MKKKISVIIVFVILMLCMCSYFAPSWKMESSENRTLATFNMILRPEKDSVVYRESPIERLEAALSDQFLFREAVVKEYLKIFNMLENSTNRIARVLSKGQDNQHVLHAIGDYEMIDDTGYITYHVPTKPMNENMVKKRVSQLEQLHEMYPELKMYVYYISQACDMPWFNEYLGTTTADYYRQIVDAIPEYVKSDRLLYKDLDDYMNIHFKTDHHWNHRGSRRGYEDIYAMMSEDIDLGEMLVPMYENNVSKAFDFDYLGRLGRRLGELYNEGYDEFSFYEHPIPLRKVSVIDPESLEEIPVVKVGLYDEYKEGKVDKKIGSDHYVIMYGTAIDSEGKVYDDKSFPVIIRNSKGNGKNLIITGDSFARAVRDTLASHFDTTVYVDSRVLSVTPIDYIIEQYNIDALLICSRTQMWDQENKLYVFREEE